MVMGQFVTTYRKDYLWPYVKTLGLKPSPEHLYQPQYRSDAACPCHCLEKPRPTSEQVLGPEAYSHDEWSRLGPMGPLLEPKVFPAKVSAAPESNVSRYNQPNVFLERVKEKYPFIYECLKSAPPDDILSRIHKDRLATTYQVDFCHKQEYVSAPYDELLRAAGVSGLPPCPEPVRLPGDICRPLQRSIITKKSGSGDIFSRSSHDRRMSKSQRNGPIEHNRKSRMMSCPKGPLGPYYRPYEIKDKFNPFGAGKDTFKRTTCCPSKLVTQITTYDPYSKNAPESSPLINKWGKMICQDVLHAHGGNFVLEPSKSK